MGEPTYSTYVVVFDLHESLIFNHMIHSNLCYCNNGSKLVLSIILHDFPPESRPKILRFSLKYILMRAVYMTQRSYIFCLHDMTSRLYGFL